MSKSAKETKKSEQERHRQWAVTFCRERIAVTSGPDREAWQIRLRMLEER